MIDKEMLEAMGQLLDMKLEPITARLNGIDQQLGSIDRRLEELEHKSDVHMTGIRLANSKLSQVVAAQNYTLEQLDLLDEVKMDKDPMRKRA